MSLRAELASARSIIDTVREPILVLDGRLHIQTASRAFYDTFQVTREDTEGRFVYELGNGQWNIPALRKLLEEVLPERKVIVDFSVTHEFPVLGRRVMLVNARQLWTDAHDSPLIFVAIEDVTERRRIHDELVRSNEEIQRFAYTAAHDLRSPLNAALSLSRLLARRVKGKLDEQESQMLLSSIDSMERLEKLMSDILTLSEMGNAPQQRRLISLGLPLQIALANLQHHIQENAAIIRLGNLPQLAVDQTQMVVVFQNLIGNALKYRRAAPPEIFIEAVLEGSDWRVSVADNGRGFDSRYASAIFEAFKRLHGTEIKGSGIGLATCKRIIERSGGRIWAESEPDQGSTFFFTLPAQQPA